MISEKNKKYNGCYVWFVAGCTTPTNSNRKDAVDGYEIWAKNGGFPEERILTSTCPIEDIDLDFLNVKEPYKTAVEGFIKDILENS